MNGQEAVSAVYQGSLVDCTKEEYEAGVRKALQDFAGKCAHDGDGLRMSIALQEVKRLDDKLKFSFE